MMSLEIQPDVVSGDSVDLDMLVTVEAAEVGDECLDDEEAAIRQVPGDVLEAAHLVPLRLQGEERVEDDVDEPKVAVDGNVREVADFDGDLLAAGLRAKTRNHRFRGVDSVNGDASCGERQRDPPGADREFECGAGAGELGEEVDRRVCVERKGLYVLVVDVRDAIAVGRGSVAHDRPILRGRILVWASAETL